LDAHALNEELFMFCETFLLKYKLLKSKSFELKEENKNMFSKLNVACKKGLRFQVKGIP